MKNNNILNIILIIIVLALTSYIVYDKIIKNEDEIVDNSTKDETVNEQVQELSYNELISEVKNKFEFTFNYANSLITYCGEHEISERASDSGNFYNVSKEFSTYDEMKNHLKQYMSEDLINKVSKYNISKENYIEENGKLYCETFGKGSGYDFGDSIIEIKSIDGDKITAVAMKELIVAAANPTIEYQKINLTLEKENNSYVVTLYEIQD